MIWSTSYHQVTLLVHRPWPHLLFTIVSVHWRQVLLKLHRPAVYRSKASDLPFTLATGPSSQAPSWSLPPWSHDSMSCFICNELLHDTITYGLIPCVSHINTISPPKVVTQLSKPNKDLSKVDICRFGPGLDLHMSCGKETPAGPNRYESPFASQ
jgi:hypothetical protein